MTRNKLFAWAVALAAALPFAAVAEDAPGVFKIPGTETTLKIYGFARFDLTYDLNQQNSWPLDITNANVSDYAGAAETDPTGDPQFGALPMTAANSRFGFSTTTPSAAGAIGVKVEGDFYRDSGAGKNIFRLRHGYGTIGDFLLLGQTWSTYRDGSAQCDTVDWGGNQSSGGGRRPQIRAMFKTGDVEIALAAETPSNPAGGIKQLPDFVASVNVPMSWGHVSLRGALVPLKDTADNSGMAYAVSLGSHLELGGDTLILEAMAGSGADQYLDMLGNQSIWGATVGTSLTGYQIVSYTVGFTHVWTPAVRSNLILSGGIMKNDQDTRPASPDPDLGGAITQNFVQGFVNVFYSVAKNAELGLEYTWGQKTDFFNNKYVVSHIAAAATYNFF